MSETFAVLRYEIDGQWYELLAPPTVFDASTEALRIANERNTPVMWTMARVSGVYAWLETDRAGLPLWHIKWPRGWRDRVQRAQVSHG